MATGFSQINNTPVALPNVPAALPMSVLQPDGSQTLSAPGYNPQNPTSVLKAPTPVVTSQAATDMLKNKIVPTMNDASAAVAKQAADKAAADLAAQTAATSTPAQKAAPVEPKTPEQIIADTPPDNHTWVYNTTTGERAALPNGVPPPVGYTQNNPNAAVAKPVVSQITTPAGTSFQKYADGTYGSLDLNGKYIGVATAQDFENAQGLQTTMNELTQLKNGTYPLSANQQAQLDGLKAQFASLIKSQEQANANYTGGMTVAQNLYGMGNSTVGLGEIKATVDSGIAKIAELNAKAASAVAAMEASFKDDDLKMLQASYNMYNDAVKARQQNLDEITKAIAAKAKDDRDFKESQRKTNLEENNRVKQYNLDVLKYQEDVKQHGIEAKYKQAQLDLDRERVAIERQKGKAYIAKLNAQQQAAEIASKATSVTGGKSVINGNGTINLANLSKMKAEFKGSQGLFDTAVSVMAYKTPLGDIKDAKVRETVRQLALAMNPNYDSKQYKTAQQYQIDYSKNSPSSLGGQRVALNSMAGHLGELAEKMAQTSDSSLGWWNSIKNTVATHGGSLIGMGDRAKAVGGLDTMRQIFSEENLKYLKGAAGGETAVARMEKLFEGGQSHEQAVGALLAVTAAINDKTITLQEAQKQAIGYIDTSRPIMNPKDAIKLDKMNRELGGNERAMADILGATPEGSIYLLRSTEEGNQRYMDSMAAAKQAIGRAPTAEELIEIFPDILPEESALSAYDPSLEPEVPEN